MCTRRQKTLEALVRSRRSPYLCKVSREGDFSIDAEMISACGYLETDGVACTLAWSPTGPTDDRPSPISAASGPPEAEGAAPRLCLCPAAPGGR